MAWASPAAALQCVPYARQASGVVLTGNAWQWWGAADGRYERGSRPQPGAVLVFKRTPLMRYGHVAVVDRIVSSREIRIHHANWGWDQRTRGRVMHDVAVRDVSPANDWTQVRVWHAPSGTFGARVNPTYGFIYASRLQDASAPPAGQAAAAAPTGHPGAKASATGGQSGAEGLNRQVLARLQTAASGPQGTGPADAPPANH